MAETRTKSSVTNIVYSFIGQISALLLSFVLRVIFVRTLSKEFLGLDSLFTSLISMLSLAELGVGSAISFSLYKPLSINDTDKIKSLMYFFKKIYQTIGVLILVLGICLSFFVESISNINNRDIPVQLIFLLFVINSSISYFYSYKKILITADQYRYITTIYRFVFFDLMVIVQMLVLVLFKKYYIYVVVMIFSTLLENILVSKKADNMYPFLREKNNKKISSVDKKEIVKNTFAMSLHKVGGVIVNSTDNIVLSKYVNLTVVGLYSNYLLITNALNLVISQLFQAIVASIGNLGVESSEKKLIDTFNFIFFCGAWFIGYCSSTLFVMINPFIEVWIGKDMLLSNLTVIIIVVNFYLFQIRRIVLTFRDALGLYWYDRYKPLVESLIKIVFSLLLVEKFSINGVILSTIISTILTSIWIEPLILYKKGFNSKLTFYFLSFFKYTIITVTLIIVTYNITNSINYFNFSNIVMLTAKFFVSFITYNIMFIILFFKSKNFNKLLVILKSIVKRN